MVNGSRRRTQTRRPRKSGGGGRFSFGSIIWAVLLLAALFAFYQIPAKPTVPGVWGILEAKSQWMQKWTHDLIESFENGKPIKLPTPDTGDGAGNGTGGATTDTPAPATVDKASKSLNDLTVAAAQNVKYARGEWRQWDNITSCWTVREQVLATQAVQDKTLTLLDKNKVRTTDLSKACSITGGAWVDPYTKVTLTNPQDLDIDHMVPLGYVAAHGGQAWSASKKEDYANDYKEVGHLLAVSASANRSKSDSGPAAWKPKNKDFWCTYAVDWVTVSASWHLSVTSGDKQALTTMLATCKS